jgi:hypothetical protein
MFKTLENLVLKTVTVTGVKLGTPADRIGLGLGVASAYPTDNLSPGLIPVPHNPEPEQVRSRQELSAMQMRKQMRAGDDAVPPASSAGCPCVPGLMADRFESFEAALFEGWQRTTRTAATGRTREVCRFAVTSRTHVPGDLRHSDRLGSDCQSPDRSSDNKRIAIRDVSSASAARK